MGAQQSKLSFGNKNNKSGFTDENSKKIVQQSNDKIIQQNDIIVRQKDKAQSKQKSNQKEQKSKQKQKKKIHWHHRQKQQPKEQQKKQQFDKDRIKIMTLNYSGILRSPFQFFPSQNKHTKQYTRLSNIFKKLLTDHLQSTKNIGNKKQKYIKEKFQWKIGNIDKQIQTKRYTPIYDKMVGLIPNPYYEQNRKRSLPKFNPSCWQCGDVLLEQQKQIDKSKQKQKKSIKNINSQHHINRNLNLISDTPHKHQQDDQNIQIIIRKRNQFMLQTQQQFKKTWLQKFNKTVKQQRQRHQQQQRKKLQQKQQQIKEEEKQQKQFLRQLKQEKEMTKEQIKQFKKQHKIKHKQQKNQINKEKKEQRKKYHYTQQNIQDMLKFDLFCYKTILLYVYRGQFNKQSDKLKNNQQKKQQKKSHYHFMKILHSKPQFIHSLDAQKYRRFMHKYFSQTFLDQQKKIQLTIKKLKLYNVDIIFIQQSTQQLRQRIQDQFKDIYYMLHKESGQSIMLLNVKRFGCNKNIQIKTKIKRLYEINWNNDTIGIIINQFIIICAHLSSKSNKNQQQKQEMVKQLQKLIKQYPDHVVICGGDINSFVQIIPNNFNKYPQTKSKSTTTKMRTWLQPQVRKAQEQIHQCKDMIITNRQLERKIVWTIDCVIPSDDMYLPMDDHPYDHFLIYAQINLKQKPKTQNVVHQNTRKVILLK